MTKKTLNKIIYFDKETIQNMLQELNSGNYVETNGKLKTSRVEGSMNAKAQNKINLHIPFLSRLSFLFTGYLSADYLMQKDKIVSITSTDISEFDKLKEYLIEKKNVNLSDIKNSSTSFRFAGGLMKIAKEGVEGINMNEFNEVMDSYDGYDTFKISEKEYVRFNNTAFVSNYKRNDILTTTMNLYCIPVGTFPKNRFDYLQQVDNMQTLFSGVEKAETLADIYPLKSDSNADQKKCVNSSEDEDDCVKLYDALYAYVLVEERHE